MVQNYRTRKKRRIIFYRKISIKLIKALPVIHCTDTISSGFIRKGKLKTKSFRTGNFYISKKMPVINKKLKQIRIKTNGTKIASFYVSPDFLAQTADWYFN